MSTGSFQRCPPEGIKDVLRKVSKMSTGRYQRCQPDITDIYGSRGYGRNLPTPVLFATTIRARDD